MKFSFKDSLGILTLKILSSLLGFFITLVFARLLGTRDYGFYACALAWIGFLGVPAMLGLDRLLVREISRYEVKAEWSRLRGLMRFSHQTVLIVSLALIAIAAGISNVLASWRASATIETFLLALILLPISALTTVRQSILRGLNKVVLGQVPRMVIRPFIILVVVISLYFLGYKKLSANWAIGINILASLLALYVASILLKREVPQQTRVFRPDYDIQGWFRSALPLLLIGSLVLFNSQIDVIMLAAMKGSTLAGIYSIAYRCASLITMVLFSINAALGPTVAALYEIGDMAQLQRTVSATARVVFLISLPLALFLFLFGNSVLCLFGADFADGFSSLKILCLGQIVNTSAGSVGLLLNMTGHERSSALGFGIGTLTNVILNAALIPRLGMEGAAIATASSLALWNVILAINVNKKIGINSTVVHTVSLKRQQF